MRRAAILTAVVTVLAGASAFGQVPAAGEMRVNSYTTGGQDEPVVASDGAGNFVVVWTSYGQDGTGGSVFGQRYDAAGVPRGGEFRVNSSTITTQSRPAVVAHERGFIVAWTGGGVWARRHDRSGLPLGSELQVNSSTTSLSQGNASIAVDGQGRFVVVWDTWQQDGSGRGVAGRRFDASGAALGPEFAVNTYTPGNQYQPVIGADASGNFVVAWTTASLDGDSYGIAGRRFDAAGAPVGAEFLVNTHTTDGQSRPAVAMGGGGDFVVTYSSRGPDGSGSGIFGQRFDAAGDPWGPEFLVNTYTTNYQNVSTIALDAHGAFVVAWTSDAQDGSSYGAFAQRYSADGVRRGVEFRVNTATTYIQWFPSVASDAVGNLAIAFETRDFGFPNSDSDVLVQRFGGLQPAVLTVDAVASSGSDGNRVLEPGETAVAVAPSWRNVNGASQTFDGVGLSLDGPAASGVSYALADAAGSYGTVANGATAPCSDCYAVSVGFGGTRPSTHWDATLTERLSPDALGQTKLWSLHLGDSFGDVPRTSGFYPFVETLLHKGVTGGCSATTYCPASPVTREQVAVFALVGKEGPGFLPPACTTPVFGDVPASSPFCRFIEELARRGVVGGCGGGNYCPLDPVTREQMPVFVLKTLEPALDPPACATPPFTDVPTSSPFCRWIAELARRGVVSGCGGGNYCPTDAVTREQMAVFIGVTFGLSLYGP